MKIKSNYKYYESYFPTSRHKKLRWREAADSLTVSVQEITKGDAPVVFQVDDYSMHANGYEITDVRMYKGKLYQVSYCHDHWFRGPHEPVPVEKLTARIERYCHCAAAPHEGSRERAIDDIRSFALSYLVIDEVVHRKCNEPMYCIYTFGLGHNHGGTSLSINWGYNSNIGHSRYFNVLQREEAIETAKSIALGRGDTESVERIGRGNIIVLDKSAVKRCPRKDHKTDGNPFMNTLHSLTSEASSATEAGLLALCATAVEISKK